MTSLTATAHYVRPAGRTYTPPAVIFADTETTWDTAGTTEVHTLRCWEAQVYRRRDRRRQGEHLTQAGTTAEDAAAVIDAWASYGESTWLYTHNLTFDLTILDLAWHLGNLGWVLSSRFGLGDGSMWCVLHKGRREVTATETRRGAKTTRQRVKWNHTLTVADSASLFPCPLADLAPLTGIAKPQLPDDEDTSEAWAARCHADVDILAAAVLTMMDWWDAMDLGHWTVTGAGQAWQHYKTTLDPRALVIDHDPAILEFERAAVYGGRRDTFRLGQLPPGRYAEVDFEAAYPTVAASFPLPARVACEITDQHRAMALRGKVPMGMLAEVTINTDRPRWPVRVAGRVFYPTGRFRTVLAAPDIRSAAEAGALAAVHRGYLYTLTSHMRGWARTVLSWVKDTSGVIPGVVRVWAKAASRYVIGKTAQRGWTTTPYCGPPCQGWAIEQCSDLYSGRKGVITGCNGDWWISWADQRGEHERPAILAFVEAHTRSRLGAVIEGPYGAGICQCDTDGILVSWTVIQQLAARLGSKWYHGRRIPAGPGQVIEEWNDITWPLVMREKTRYAKVTVYGPQQMQLDGKLRASGVTKGAWQTGKDTWLGRLWPGITWQSQHGAPGTYQRPLQPYRVIGPYTQAWALVDGSVRAAETSIGPDGDTYLVHWKQTRWHAAGAVLAERQASWATGLWEAAVDE